MTVKKIANEYDDIKGFLNKIRKIQATAPSNKYGLIGEQIDSEEDSRGPVTAEYGYGAGTKKPIPRSVNTPEQPDAFDDNEDTVQDPTIKNVPGEEEQEDIAVINDVEVEIHSEDPEDLALQDDEKKAISQLIDDFRKEVSEIAEFDKLHIYADSAKFDGKVSNIDMGFTLSTGDDTGLYISNPSLLKISDESLDIINKLNRFLPKFSNTINNLLVNRSST